MKCPVCKTGEVIIGEIIQEFFLLKHYGKGSHFASCPVCAASGIVKNSVILQWVGRTVNDEPVPLKKQARVTAKKKKIKLEITGCISCPIPKLYRSSFCPLIERRSTGTCKTVIYAGDTEDKIDEECPLWTYATNKKKVL